MTKTWDSIVQVEQEDPVTNHVTVYKVAVHLTWSRELYGDDADGRRGVYEWVLTEAGANDAWTGSDTVDPIPDWLAEAAIDEAKCVAQKTQWS